MATGDNLFVATGMAATVVVVADTDAARAAGEKAGANMTMHASIMEQRRRLEHFLRVSLDAQRAGFWMNDGCHGNDLDMSLTPT
mmetsp:Transcript_4809/g.8024  ORF Transcript_4809/g.8024 Transcript_4809/m.8024 type:complete len:84 (-) Transcript_4809:139-390(-)|eukprot:CAMPEP_0196217602 /NCGR_PEP_ID=MMETSP0912-20130531/34774_1 /TAXON_ID=49265 /ORGANISM="Thalassiosira rotula, Strain GSO102" /LENGTH=83 /DNA_ID=CAMNT_0041495069 /DNA_START=115 /DNA_END=366 /DNA_ORIENTATION=-